jgi:CheY-like chemotaxis protein
MKNPLPDGSARPTILIVEDEGIVAKDLQLRLKKLGYSVPAIAKSADEAVRKAALLHPALVLMDVHLEGTADGIEAARRIREMLNIPILFLSAYGDEETRHQALEQNPVAYLGKPIEDHQLYAALNAFFSRTSGTRKPRP